MLSLSWPFWFRTLDISLPGRCSMKCLSQLNMLLTYPTKGDLMLGEFRKLNDLFLMIA